MTSTVPQARRPVIAGLGITEQGKVYGRTAAQFAADAVRLAVADAGLALGDVDGLLTSSGVTWSPAAGSATVVSWSLVHGRAGRIVLVIAELDEGPWWWSQLVEAEPDQVAIGARLTLTYRRFDDQHEWVTVFTPAWSPPDRASKKSTSSSA